MDDFGYITEMPGKWQPWFAWYPIKTIDNKLVWLKKIQKKTIVWVAGLQNTAPICFSTKEYKTK